MSLIGRKRYLEQKAAYKAIPLADRPSWLRPPEAPPSRMIIAHAKPPAPPKMKIVLAWTTEEPRLEREGRIDIGERHTFKMVRVPKAVMWLNRGSEKDLATAILYAAQQSTPQQPHHVFTYPTSERDPLGRAKKDVLSR